MWGALAPVVPQPVEGLKTVMLDDRAKAWLSSLHIAVL